MSSIFATAAEVQEVCRSRDWPFCFIGGLAVQRWGEPRATLDVDLTILTGFGGEQPVIERLLEGFSSRVADARDFALRHRILLLESTEGIGIDVSLGALPYEERVIARAGDHELVAGQPLRLCSAEDLVVLKAFAGRHIDWADVERIAARMGDELDADLIVTEATELLEVKEALDDLDRLRMMLRA